MANSQGDACARHQIKRTSFNMVYFYTMKAIFESEAILIMTHARATGLRYRKRLEVIMMIIRDCLIL